MKVYIEFLKNAFQSNLAYKMNVFLSLISSIVVLLVQIYFWRALFQEIGQTHTNMGVISFRDMVTYTLVSTGISIAISTTTVFKVNDKIRSGEIAMDLIKPVSLKGMLFCDALGNNSFRMVFELMPFLIVGILMFGIRLPSESYSFLFVISAINGMLIYFSISYLIGLIGFWFLSVGSLSMLFNVLINVFSGQMVPLWFFPQSLFELSIYLPFRLIYFAPLSIFLEKTALADAIGVILHQLLWIGILVGIEKVLWFRAVRKLVIQGG